MLMGQQAWSGAWNLACLTSYSDVAAAAGLWTMDADGPGRAMLLLFAIYPQLQAQT